MLFHDNEIPKITIPVNNSVIYMNTNHKYFYTLPEAAFSNLKTLESVFINLTINKGRNRLFTINQIDIIRSVLTAGTKTDFEKSFSNLYHELDRLKEFRSGSLSKQRSCLMKLVFRLWSEGIILFPAGVVSQENNCLAMVYKNINWTNDVIGSGKLHDAINLVHKTSYYTSANCNERVIRRLRELFVCIGPVKDFSYLPHLDVEMLLSILPTAQKQNLKYLYRGLNVLVGDNNFHFILKSKTFPQKIFRTKRSDFEWCVETDPSLEEWRREAADWIQSFTNKKNLSTCITIINKFFDYLISCSDVTRNPVEYISSYYSDNSMIEYVCSDLKRQQTCQQYLSKLYDFFELLLGKYATANDDDEGTYRLPGFCNPIRIDDIPTQNVRAGRTHRIPMPRLLLQKAKEIIVENDFAWCKKFEEDYFKWIDPAIGKAKIVWSPVRAYAILLKMLLPLRTYQVRMLDSGEGDPERFDYTQSKWVLNTSQHAHHWESGFGFLRKMYDNELCKYLTGFYINTNKTQDRQTLYVETGYDIPWENEEVIRLACSLRDFQEKYNPVTRPTAYTELIYESMPSRDVAERIPHRFYLFRDPCKDVCSHPVTDGRLSWLWRKLLIELQDRMKKEGYGDVVLVHGQNGCLFDLHCLRVTGLTMLAEKGVPIEILSKLVAGHATILMTLYYTKFSIGHITDTLNEAQLKAEQNARAEFADFIKANTFTSLKSAVAFNADDALQFTVSTDFAVWRFLDYGICPVGCTKCDEGGPSVVNHADRKVHVPVPGGTMNCACCRFFLTGPPFLGPLVAKYNEMINVLDVYGSEMREHQANLQRVMRDKINAEQQGEEFLNMKSLRILEGNVEESMEKLDVCGITCHHLYNLVHQSLAIQKNWSGKQNSNLPLIYQCESNELQAHLVECTKYDLYDEICQSGEYYKSINTSMAKLQRKNLFYRMLVRNGKGAMFLDLDDDAFEKAINAANRLMYKRLGRETTNRLINGNISLDSIDNKFMHTLECVISEELGNPLRLCGSTIGLEDKTSTYFFDEHQHSCF